MTTPGAAAAAAPVTSEEWFEMNLPGSGQRCVAAYGSEGYDFVKRALPANHDTYVNYTRDHQAATNLNASTSDAFNLFDMTAKTNAAALNIINWENRHETETRTLKYMINHLELLIVEELSMYEAITELLMELLMVKVDRSTHQESR